MISRNILPLIGFCHIMKIYESNTFLSVISFLVPYVHVEKSKHCELLTQCWEGVNSWPWASHETLYQIVKFECVQTRQTLTLCSNDLFFLMEVRRFPNVEVQPTLLTGQNRPYHLRQKRTEPFREGRLNIHSRRSLLLRSQGLQFLAAQASV